MNEYEKNLLFEFLQNRINEVPLIINEELKYKNKKFNHRNDFNELTDIIDNFLDNETINRYIVLPGLRGVGKTTILYQIYEYLEKTKNISPDRILYLSCEDLNRIIECNILETVEYYVKEFHNSSIRTLDKEIFILIDESHYDKNWSLAGKIIYDQTKKIFMIFTGSSALNLEYDAEASRRLIKNTICPLNYSQHLKLKYNYDTKNISNELFNLLFTSDIEKVTKLEKDINTDLLNLKNYTSSDWDNYLKFGGFPSVLHESNQRFIYNKLYSSVDTIIRKDLGTIKNITTKSEDQASRLLQSLAQKLPGDVSQNTMANCIKSSPSTANSLLRILEKTHLIFHYEPYVGPNGRAKKSWQYYFASPSIRHAINQYYGFSPMKKEDYEGILVENLVASLLFNLMNCEKYFNFNVFFELEKKGVDFLIKKEFDAPIPIEVGAGNKTKRQIKRAINKFDSNYGFIISNTRNKIEKEDDVIYIPLKTFSMI